MTYNPRKAAQTIAYLSLKNDGEPLFIIKAVKLVYLADRESLRRRGHPIQSESRVSMPHGPVNSLTLDYLNGAYDQQASGWSDFLSDRANNLVGLSRKNITASDLDQLSRAEMSILDSVWEEFGKMDRFELRDWTHDPDNVPEWEDPNGSSSNIPLAKMMAAVGLNQSIQRARELESLEQASHLLDAL